MDQSGLGGTGAFSLIACLSFRRSLLLQFACRCCCVQAEAASTHLLHVQYSSLSSHSPRNRTLFRFSLLLLQNTLPVAPKPPLICLLSQLSKAAINMPKDSKSKRVVLLFSADPSNHPFPSPSSSIKNPHPAPPKLAFHQLPTTQPQLDQNFAIWRAVQSSTIHPSIIPTLSADPKIELKPLHIPIFLMRIPKTLFSWLAKLNWGEVMHATLCLLHRAALEGMALQTLYKGLRRELWSMTKQEDYWVGVDRDNDGEPEFGFAEGDTDDDNRFDTELSRELVQIKVALSRSQASGNDIMRLTPIRIQSRWTLIPTAVSIDAHMRFAIDTHMKDEKQEIVNRADAVVHALWALWLMFANVAMRNHYRRQGIYAARFSELIAQHEFEKLWRQIDALHQMGRVRKRCRCPLSTDQHGKIVVNKDEEGSDSGCRWQEKGLETVGDKERAVKRGFQSFANVKRFPGRICKRRKVDTVNKDTFFAFLPEEVITDHIIPSLCIGKGKFREHMRFGDSDMYSE